MMDTEAMVRDVFARVKDNTTNESCGFIIEGRHSPLYFEAENIAVEPWHQFAISPKDYVRASQLGKIIAVYHSHTQHRDATPSDADRRTAARLGIPMLIVSIGYGVHHWIKPDGDDFPYAGRVYVFGVFDCYELARDYYARELSIKLPHIESEFGAFHHGANHFVEHFAEMGFYEVPRELARKHDGLLMQLTAPVPDHVAIFCGDGFILQHLYNRLSGRSLYGSYWRNRTRHVLRHHSLFKLGDVYYGDEGTVRWK